MKIATWNVNGIRARHEQFARFVAEEQPDVVCLQEIKAKIDQVPQTCFLEGYTCYWHGAGG
jgi:exodeoxyribonuclease-3